MEKSEMMKHTKEPWKVCSDLPVYAIYSESENFRVSQTANQNNHKTYGSSYANTGIPKYQDAERIVSCVNNCAGITDEALEAGIIEDALYFLINHNRSVTQDEKGQYFYNGIRIWEEVK